MHNCQRPYPGARVTLNDTDGGEKGGKKCLHCSITARASSAVREVEMLSRSHVCLKNHLPFWTRQDCNQAQMGEDELQHGEKGL